VQTQEEGQSLLSTSEWKKGQKEQQGLQSVQDGG
jgi:hypothetical protein